MDRPVPLEGRQIIILQDLLVLRLELMGAEFPARRLSEAREHLSHRTPEELHALLDRLADELVDRAAAVDEPDATG
jgi:hypothetical protein